MWHCLRLSLLFLVVEEIHWFVEEIHWFVFSNVKTRTLCIAISQPSREISSPKAHVTLSLTEPFVSTCRGNTLICVQVTWRRRLYALSFHSLQERFLKLTDLCLGLSEGTKYFDMVLSVTFQGILHRCFFFPPRTIWYMNVIRRI